MVIVETEGLVREGVETGLQKKNRQSSNNNTTLQRKEDGATLLEMQLSKTNSGYTDVADNIIAHVEQEGHHAQRR